MSTTATTAANPFDLPLPGSRDPRDPERLLPSGRQRVSKAEVARIQRERLIDACVRCVAEDGYGRTNVRNICQRAAVSTRAFYEHFATKEDVFLQAYQAGIDIVFDRAYSVYRSTGGPWDLRIRAGIQTLLETLAECPSLAAMIMVEAIRTGPTGLDHVGNAFRRSFELFADLENPPPAPLTPADVLPQVIGGIYLRVWAEIQAGRTAQLAELTPVLTYCAILPFVGPERAEQHLAGDPPDGEARV